MLVGDLPTGKPELEAPAEVDHDRSVLNSLGNFEFEMVGFMKKDAESTSGKLPCEVAGDAPPAAQAKKNLMRGKPSTVGSNSSSPAAESNSEEAAEYRKNIKHDVPPTEVWKKMSESRRKLVEELENERPNETTELEYLKLERDIKEEDRFHWRIGQLAFEDETRRNDYYAMHNVGLKLNKARWQLLEAATQKGQKMTGQQMRCVFWKESCFSIIDKGKMTQGQFVDGHPTLRPFADAVHRRKMTKAYLRGFVEARLKVLQQPANVKQLFDHFDRMYGYFYNALLELLEVRKNDVAEHLMSHLGRANGLIQHAVLLWREYSRLNTTLIPADICADNHVNLALLKNLRLATMDRCVRRCLLELTFHARNELDHVRALAPMCPTRAWPLMAEALLPNYYVNFLDRNEYDVTRWFVETMPTSPGFQWFMYKQFWHWHRTQDLTVFARDVAPVPFLPSFMQFGGKSREPLDVPGFDPKAMRDQFDSQGAKK